MLVAAQELYLFLFLLTEAHVKNILANGINFTQTLELQSQDMPCCGPTVPMSILRRIDEMTGSYFKLIMTLSLNPWQDHREDRAPYVDFPLSRPSSSTPNTSSYFSVQNQTEGTFISRGMRWATMYWKGEED